MKSNWHSGSEALEQTIKLAKAYIDVWWLSVNNTLRQSNDHNTQFSCFQTQWNVASFSQQVYVSSTRLNLYRHTDDDDVPEWFEEFLSMGHCLSPTFNPTEDFIHIVY